MSDKPLMTDVRQAFDAVRENAGAGSPFQGAAPAAVDAAALVMAQKARGRLSEVRDLALTWDQWTRLIAILRQEFAIAIRHAAFDPPEFPGDVKPGSRQFATAQACVRAGCGGYLRWRGSPLSSWECDRCLCDENGRDPQVNVPPPLPLGTTTDKDHHHFDYKPGLGAWVCRKCSMVMPVGAPEDVSRGRCPLGHLDVSQG